MAQILQFPRSRDRSFVLRQAQWLEVHSAEAGERYLDRLLHQHAKRLAGRGVASTAIEDECGSLRGAIHAEAARLSLRAYGGAA